MHERRNIDQPIGIELLMDRLRKEASFANLEVTRNLLGQFNFTVDSENESKLTVFQAENFREAHVFLKGCNIGRLYADR